MELKEIFNFLTTLRENNNREWFLENKVRYNQHRDSYAQFIELLIFEISQFDGTVKGLLPKDCIYRINRDIRFSKDKSPYKTHFGAYIVPGGKKSGKAGYYFHIEPGNSLVAGGIYMPETTVLKRIRQDIYENFDEFNSIVTEEKFVSTFGGLKGDKLKTPPRGFPKDSTGIEYLKFKQFGAVAEITDEDMMVPNLLDKVISKFRVLSSLILYLNHIVEDV